MHGIFSRNLGSQPFPVKGNSCPSQDNRKSDYRLSTKNLAFQYIHLLSLLFLFDPTDTRSDLLYLYFFL